MKASTKNRLDYQLSLRRDSSVKVMSKIQKYIDEFNLLVRNAIDVNELQSFYNKIIVNIEEDILDTPNCIEESYGDVFMQIYYIEYLADIVHFKAHMLSEIEKFKNIVWISMEQIKEKFELSEKTKVRFC